MIAVPALVALGMIAIGGTGCFPVGQSGTTTVDVTNMGFAPVQLSDTTIYEYSSMTIRIPNGGNDIRTLSRSGNPLADLSILSLAGTSDVTNYSAGVVLAETTRYFVQSKTGNIRAELLY